MLFFKKDQNRTSINPKRVLTFPISPGKTYSNVKKTTTGKENTEKSQHGETSHNNTGESV